MKLLEWRGLPRTCEEWQKAESLATWIFLVCGARVEITLGEDKHGNDVFMPTVSVQGQSYDLDDCNTFGEAVDKCDEILLRKLLSSGVVAEVAKVNSETTKPSEV